MASDSSPLPAEPPTRNGGQTTMRASWAGKTGANVPNGVPVKGYVHLRDILASAQPDLDPGSPINLQLEKAKAYISTAKRSVEFKRPDLAYKDYIKGAEITVNYIPRNKDFNFYCNTKKGWEQEYQLLIKQVRNMEAMMEQIRRMIEEDNARTGVQPTVQSRPVSRVDITSNSSPDRGNDGFQMPNAPKGVPHDTLQNGHSTTNGHDKVKPKPGPKPESLHSSRQSVDLLSQRFARLRTPGTGSVSGIVNIPTPEDYMSSKSAPTLEDSRSKASNNGTLRPAGPRDMPTHPPSLPPKIPLSTALPRAPSPTYSPSTVSVSSTGSLARTSTDNPRPSLEKRQTYYNQPNPPGVSQQLQRTRDENPYRPRTPNGVHPSIMPKSSSSDIPNDPSITVEKLVKYMRKYNVLLIDVRSRDQFDNGHIFHNSIICIEPLALQPGVSAEDLEERLVLSPESEQEQFSKRDEYDIVVYYDQNTTSTSYLVGPPSSNETIALRALYDTLYEFNEYKPLRDGRPPALLIGGLEAWVDFMGQSSLKSSTTAGLMGSTKPRYPLGVPGRALKRHRLASVNSSLEVRKRRLRHHKPLDQDEERAWIQKAQAEEVKSEEYIPDGDGESAEPDAYDDEPASPFVPDYESFLRRFPELDTAPQSMVVPSRPSLPQPHFNRITSTPPVPSRPPPALPRPSYSGLSEKPQTQVDLARQNSATRPALYSSGSIARRLKLPRTGLVNFHSTCYMNATIQCLSGTVLLSQFFLEDRYKQFVQKSRLGSSGIMPGLYTNLIRSLWKSDVEAIKPTTFRTFCGRMKQEWAVDDQQDAKEFYDFLVDCLHEDLNINWTRSHLKPLTPAEELQRERTPVSVASGYEWQRFQHRDHSYISSLFAGQHASRLRCTTCGSTSTTYEAFYSISVEIPQRHGSSANLQDCLRSYTQEETLSGDEGWKCPHCKCEREATKQIILTRLPEFLVIHFKRFSASYNQSAKKIQAPVDFPLHNFRMDDFVFQHPPPVTSAGKNPGEDALPIDRATTPPYSYSCYGVLRHLGTSLNSGHYIALVKDQGRGCWREFNDTHTRDFDPARLQGDSRLQNGQAYILFYQRDAPH